MASEAEYHKWAKEAEQLRRGLDVLEMHLHDSCPLVYQPRAGGWVLSVWGGDEIASGARLAELVLKLADK